MTGSPALALQADTEGLAQWRERFLATMLRYAWICGVVVAIPSSWSALRNGNVWIFAVDVAALAWLFVLWWSRRWPYTVRAWGFVLLIYALGTWFVVSVGVVALIYMAAFPVMAALLLGLRASAASLVLNGLTLLALGQLVMLSWPPSGRNPAPSWGVVTLNFVFVNSVITTAAALMLQRLERALERQRVVNSELLHEVQERQRAEDEVRRLNAGLEERVRRRTRELEEAGQEMEAYSYTVSHDLRGPLNSIDGFSHLLQKALGPQPPAQAAHALSRIRANVARMSDLIEALLSLSQLSRSSVRRTPVDLGAVVREVLAAHREAEPERQVEQLVADGLVVQGDARLVRALLENLLGNAWKFSSREPVARIEFGRADPTADGASAYFVRDNGAGFDMAYADKLFGTFQRLHAADDFPGTGVGLATVRRIAALHGGRVWAESAPGQGATFYFTLEPAPFAG